MAINPLPPQAYTKETLQKAYAWLLTQSTSVKEMAHDQNILVSLYLKAQRNGEASLEAPSIQNFKQELKSLAHMMGDFQQGSNSTNSINQAQPIQTQQQVYPSFNSQSNSQLVNHQHSVSPQFTQTNSLTNPHLTHVNPSVINANATISATQAIHTQTVQTITHTNNGMAINPNQVIPSILDDKSLEAISIIKNQLNIGSDLEALRVLITFGLKHFNKLDL